MYIYIYMYIVLPRTVSVVVAVKWWFVFQSVRWLLPLCFLFHDAYGCFERGFGAGGSYPSTSPAAHSLGPSSAAG